VERVQWCLPRVHAVVLLRNKSDEGRMPCVSGLLSLGRTGVCVRCSVICAVTRARVKALVLASIMLLHCKPWPKRLRQANGRWVRTHVWPGDTQVKLINPSSISRNARLYFCPPVNQVQTLLHMAPRPAFIDI